VSEREEKKIKMAHLEETNQNQKIEIQIVKTTGGSFEVTVDNDITVENLRKIVSKKLKISKDRICLMNSER
jgi:chromosomal replication initiation ATPase DnaA